MIRVLELRPNPISKNNGIDTYCQSLRQLFEKDVEVEILPIENYPQKRTKWLHEVYNYKALLREIQQKNPTCVHINGYTSFSVTQAFFAAKQCNCKIIYTAHWHPFRFLKHPFVGRLFFNVLVKPFVALWADAVTTINNDDTSYFKKFHKNVVKISHWLKGDMQPINMSADKKKNMILFVGRVSDDNKGVKHLYSLPEGKYDIHCVGVGNMLERSDITRHINIPNEELQRLYAEASLLVVPSKYEAFSYVALEALLNKTPVLISTGVRIADYLNNVSGVGVFDFNDFDTFNKMVNKYIGTKVDVETIKGIFSPENQKEKYKKVFLSINN